MAKAKAKSRAEAAKENSAAARAAAAATPAEHGDKPLKVRATQTGYFNDERKREGDVFTIPNGRAFSSVWMEVVSKTTPEKTSGPQETLNRGRGTGDADVFGD